MHIADGVLSGEVLAGASVLAAAAVGAGLYRLDHEKLPRAGVVSAVFFVASLIHIPIGPSSAHLVLAGLMGLMLGWASFPAVAVALLLQSILFGYGGITALGANILVMGVPAVACHHVFGRRIAADPAGSRAFVQGLAAGAAAIVTGCLIAGLLLYLSAGEYIGAAALLLAAHIPVAVAEAFITGAAAAFLTRVRPEVFGTAPAEGAVHA